MGDTKFQLLEIIKRSGELDLDTAEEKTGLARTTLKEHLTQLERDNFISRSYRKQGRGRPKLVFTLSEEGRRQFPSKDHEMLSELLRFLKDEGEQQKIQIFFKKFWDQRFNEARHRLERHAPDDMKGRLQTLKEMLEEQGFMPEIDMEDHKVNIRECNCPFPEAVKETRLPCKLEAQFFASLLDGQLNRVSYIPNGHPACEYELDFSDS